MKNIILLKIIILAAFFGFAVTNYAAGEDNLYNRNTVTDQANQDEENSCDAEKTAALAEEEISRLIRANVLTSDSSAERFNFVEGAEVTIISRNKLLVNAPGGGGHLIECGNCPSTNGCYGDIPCRFKFNLFGWHCRGRCGGPFSGCGGCGVNTTQGGNYSGYE